MQLPPNLQTALDLLFNQVSASELTRARASLTEDYKKGHASEFSRVKLLAYLAARLPATYAAIYKVLQSIPPPTHLLDLGAGPGTASWAAAELFPALQKITLIEQSMEAIAVGKTLAQHSSHPALLSAQWIHQSLSSPFPPADTAILSYVLNEIKDPISLIEPLWASLSTLIILEPGTPKGADLIRKLRHHLLQRGAFILAPCPHAHACPSDWCHFSARVERTRLHRLLKEGTLGYEDEKFSYLIVSKTPAQSQGSRILRHPLKQSGHVRLSLCASSGQLEEKVVTRSDKESYRKARDAEWGDTF